MSDITRDYNIALLEKSEFDKIIPLLQVCFGMMVNIDYFKWKFLQNPSGELIAFVAKQNDNTIVAFEGLIPEVYNFDSKATTIYQSVDTMTHPDHRGKGLFRKLAKSCYEYIESNNLNTLIVTGFGGAASTSSLLKLGWQYVFDIPFFFRTKQQAVVQGLIPFRQSLDSGFEIKEITAVSEIMPVVDSHRAVETKISIVKDEKFIRWRISNPRFVYRIAGIYNPQGIVAGYLIYYIENNKIMLFDAGFNTPDRKCEISLFRWLDNLLLKNNYKGIVTFSQQKIRYSDLLLRNGFICNKLGLGPLSKKLPFVYYAQRELINKYNNESFWSITPCDHDAF